MASSQKPFQVYEELADREARSGTGPQRDRYLVLAADAAFLDDEPGEADRLRQRLLQLNPHHLLKPYRSWVDALQSPDVRSYLIDLRKQCSVEQAERLLRQPAAAPAAELPRDRLKEAAAAPPVLKLPDPPARPVSPPVPPSPARPVKAAPPVLPKKPAVAFPAAPPAPAPARLDEEKGSLSWLPFGLFVLFLLTAIFMTAYTLAQPFFPE